MLPFNPSRYSNVATFTAASGGGGAWDPSQDTNMKLWVKSTAGVTGNPTVTTWADQSGNSNTVSPFLAGSPGTNVLFSSTSFNSTHPGLTMNKDVATANYLQRGTTGSMSLNSATVSAFVTFAPLLSHSGTQGRLLAVAAAGQTNDYDNTSSFIISADVTGSKLFGYANNGYIGTSGGAAITDTTPITAGVIFDGTHATFYIQGTAVGSSIAWSTNIGNGTGVTFRMLDTISGSNILSAVLAEAILSTSVLNPTDYQTYAHTTWGV